jgi:cell division protease FtsH
LSDLAKNVILWVVIAIVLVSVFQNFGMNSAPTSEKDYTAFLDEVADGTVAQVVFAKKKDEPYVLTVTTQDDTVYVVNSPETDNTELITTLRAEGVQIVASEPQQDSLLMLLFVNAFPILLLIAVWIYFMRQMQGAGGGRGAMSFGKSRARLLGEDQVNVTFADVAGVEEAKEEVVEIVDFLKDPSKFQRLGGKIPKGVLMVGSPGTGKTLLARAIAGEAKVPFFTISGSDFVEMFVGVGASRVRDMFEQAKKHAPCIIFIDEIDAVGRHRGAGLGGGHDEREQTLNQLLVEMDGFEGNEGVIVIAATNRPDVLDPALLRPGRFDRQVVVPLPDVRGREQILKVHMRKVPLDGSVKPQVIARGTPGFSGADLANLVNEAALLAARANKRTVTMEEFDKAKDKILMGAERRSMVMSESEKKLTAFHEAGHAIVGWLVPEHDPVYKVTIIPRGRALGVTMYLPEDDRYSHSRQRLKSRIKSLFGGRLAEELVFGSDYVTTGASNDIERATEIARNMVTKWGLSERLGRSVTRHKQVSDVTAHVIDEEIKELIDGCYQDAKRILQDNFQRLHTMAEALIKYETLGEEQIKDIMEGREPRPPQDWDEPSEQGPAVKPEPKESGGKTALGGPASQH